MIGVIFHDGTKKPFLDELADIEDTESFYISWGDVLFDDEEMISSSWSSNENVNIQFSSFDNTLKDQCGQELNAVNLVNASFSEAGEGELTNSIITNQRILNRGFKFKIGDI